MLKFFSVILLIFVSYSAFAEPHRDKKETTDDLQILPYFTGFMTGATGRGISIGCSSLVYSVLLSKVPSRIERIQNVALRYMASIFQLVVINEVARILTPLWSWPQTKLDSAMLYFASGNSSLDEDSRISWNKSLIDGHGAGSMATSGFFFVRALFESVARDYIRAYQVHQEQPGNQIALSSRHQTFSYYKDDSQNGQLLKTLTTAISREDKDTVKDLLGLGRMRNFHPLDCYSYKLLPYSPDISVFSPFAQTLMSRNLEVFKMFFDRRCFEHPLTPELCNQIRVYIDPSLRMYRKEPPVLKIANLPTLDMPFSEYLRNFILKKTSCRFTSADTARMLDIFSGAEAS